jgi:hypothetical protein
MQLYLMRKHFCFFQTELEINDEVDLVDLGIAKRQPWDYTVTTKELEKRESKYFQVFLIKM